MTTPHILRELGKKGVPMRDAAEEESGILGLPMSVVSGAPGYNVIQYSDSTSLNEVLSEATTTSQRILELLNSETSTKEVLEFQALEILRLTSALGRNLMNIPEMGGLLGSFYADHYVRTILSPDCLTPEGPQGPQMYVMNWGKGTKSKPHSHPGGMATYLVISSGLIRNKLYALDHSTGKVRIMDEQNLREGDMLLAFENDQGGHLTIIREGKAQDPFHIPRPEEGTFYGIIHSVHGDLNTNVLHCYQDDPLSGRVFEEAA